MSNKPIKKFKLASNNEPADHHNELIVPIVHLRNRSRANKISKHQTESVENQKLTTLHTENSPVLSKGSLESYAPMT